MRFRKLVRAISMTAPLFAVLILPAAAQTQLFTFIGPGNNLNPANSEAVHISFNGGTNVEYVWAGRYQGQLGSGPVFNIFCTDVSHEIGPPNQYTADVSQKITNPIVTGQDSNGGYNGGLASAIMNPNDYQIPAMSVTSADALIRADEVGYLADHYLDAIGLSTDQSTAIGVSIWDIIQDGGDGLSNGSVVSSDTGAWTSLVSNYESEAKQYGTGPSDTAYWIQAVEPYNGYASHAQDYVYEVPTPEPSSVAAFAFTGLGMMGLMLRARKARRNMAS